MNGTDIKNYTFDKGAFGYKVEDVTACLNDVSEYVVSLENQISKYKLEVKQLKEKNDKVESDEDNVKEIIVSAQKFSSNVMGEARAKAQDIIDKAERKKADFDSEISTKTDMLMANAKQKADKMVADAIYKSENMTRDAQKKLDNETKQLKAIKKEVSDFKARLLSLYKSHLDIITKMPEFSELVEDKDSKAQEAPVAKPEEKTEPKIESSEPKKSPEPEIQMDDKDSTRVIDLAKEDRKAAKPVSPVSPITNTRQFDKKDEKKSDDKKEKNPTFKITITENKTAKETKNEAAKERDRFKSRFGELKFGEHKPEDD